MVQCDGCNKWYHFSCVEVTSGVANHSWICPKCPYMHFRGSNQVEQPPVLQQTPPVVPPPNLVNSRMSTGKPSSNRSNQRKVDRLLQKLEEQKQLEQKFLEEKYRILDEEDDDDDETVADDEEVGFEEMSKVRGWLRDTDKCGEDYDSGMVEEDINDNQLQAIVQQVRATGHTEPRSTLHGFFPNQRSTPRETVPMNSRLRSRVVQPSMPAPIPEGLLRRPPATVSEEMFRQSAVPDVQFRLSTAPDYQFRQSAVLDHQFRKPVVPDYQFHQPPATAPKVQFRRPPAPAPDGVFRRPPSHTVHQSAPAVGAQSYQPLGLQPAPAPGTQLHHSQAPQMNPTPGIQGARQIPAAPNGQFWPEPTFVPENPYHQPPVSGNHMRQGDSTARGFGNPEPEPRDVEENVCILNRSQLAARQAVSKELPEFYGNPEDWPLFFSMYNSSTQMCGFSNEENMLRLRKCLKGKALDAVRCRLLHPSNVNGVIATLKMLYGRPEAMP